MLNRLIILAVCIAPLISPAQQPKPAIPYWGPAKWTKIDNTKISTDGKTIAYEEIDQNGEVTNKRLVIQSLDTRKKSILDDMSSLDFTSDGKYLILLNKENNIRRFNIRSQKLENITADKLPSDVAGRKSLDSQVVAYHVVEGKDKILVLKKENQGAVNLIVTDTIGKTVARLLQAKDGVSATFRIFAGTKYLLVTVTEPMPSVNPELPNVDVWTWTDANNPNPYNTSPREITTQFAFDTDDNRLVRLAGKYERVEAIKADNAIVREGENEPSTERWWNPRARAKFYVVSLKDGQRHLIKKEEKYTFTSNFSPDGRYIIVSDEETLSFSVYDTEQHRLYDISKGKDITLSGYSYVDKRFLSNDLAFPDNQHVIIRDAYDLWKLDLTGKNDPVCLTGGFGRKENIEFRPLRVRIGQKDEVFTRQQQGYLLSSFDLNSKGWGIYSVSSLNGEQPKRLVIGQHYYLHGDNAVITKAASANVYLVQRESVNDAPNLFVSKDLKNFERLTDIQPHRAYNWMNVDLVRWKTEAGRDCEGMLYKPENMDPAKKYPVVTLIYNEFSHYMFRYPHFDVGEYGALNLLPLTSLVSNGYLVFVPDLGKRKLNEYLKETCRMIVPGVKKIAGLPYVDGTKIGIEGGSWGGVQTNYIITQTNVFAAAHSAAGYSELISHSGYSDAYMQRNNMPAEGFHLGGLLTEVPESYISQSALFHANKVTTPLLLRHNKDDGAVSFYHSLQYFRSLRRLQKPVWMLQYEGQDHGVAGKNEFKDLCIRVGQFFDHYLRNAPAPVWMTKGIEPEMKQVTSGYELLK